MEHGWRRTDDTQPMTLPRRRPEPNSAPAMPAGDGWCYSWLRSSARGSMRFYLFLPRSDVPRRTLRTRSNSTRDRICAGRQGAKKRPNISANTELSDKTRDSAGVPAAPVPCSRSQTHTTPTLPMSGTYHVGGGNQKTTSNCAYVERSTNPVSTSPGRTYVCTAYRKDQRKTAAWRLRKQGTRHRDPSERTKVLI